MPRPLARPLPRRHDASHPARAGRGPLALFAPSASAQAAARRRARGAARGSLPNADRAAPASDRRRGGLSLCAKRALKAATLRDCGRRCVYCAAALAPDAVTLDHVYPRARGGPDVAGNVVAACLRCNRLKADLLPTEFFLRHPWAGANFVRYARAVHRALKRGARRAVSLAYAAEAEARRAA